MKPWLHEEESIEPLIELERPDIIAVNLRIWREAHAPDAAHRATLRIILPKDDQMSLEEVLASARSKAAEVLSEMSRHMTEESIAPPG